MTTQTEAHASPKDDALKLALEALEEIHVGNMTPMAEINWNKAITAIKEFLAQDALQALHNENKRLGLYEKGYADAMNWKVQNHLEHLPAKEQCTYPKCNYPCMNLPDCKQPEQEPVAWELGAEVYWGDSPELSDYVRKEGTPLYTTPPQRTWERPWVSLTDKEIEVIAEEFGVGGWICDFARGLEATLKEKNNGSR